MKTTDKAHIMGCWSMVYANGSCDASVSCSSIILTGCFYIAIAILRMDNRPNLLILSWCDEIYFSILGCTPNNSINVSCFTHFLQFYYIMYVLCQNDQVSSSVI